MTWNRGDVCGKFIPMADFDEGGGAIRWMVTPDSHYSREEYETLCRVHAIRAEGEKSRSDQTPGDSMLSELIGRLEKSTGPDRELDCAIAYAVDFKCEGTETTWRQLVDQIGMEYAVANATRFHSFWREAIPQFTGSVDAALTLVPEGWNWQAQGNDVLGRVKPYAIMGLPGQAEADGMGASPAIALCIASLKARLSLGAKPQEIP